MQCINAARQATLEQDRPFSRFRQLPSYHAIGAGPLDFRTGECIDYGLANLRGNRRRVLLTALKRWGVRAIDERCRSTGDDDVIQYEGPDRAGDLRISDDAPTPMELKRCIIDEFRTREKARLFGRYRRKRPGRWWAGARRKVGSRHHECGSRSQLSEEQWNQAVPVEVLRLLRLSRMRGEAWLRVGCVGVVCGRELLRESGVGFCTRLLGNGGYWYASCVLDI